MQKRDRVDLYCNHIHVTCIAMQRLRKETPYRCDRDFREQVERFCQYGRDLMSHIRNIEGEISQQRERLQRYAGLNPL